LEIENFTQTEGRANQNDRDIMQNGRTGFQIPLPGISFNALDRMVTSPILVHTRSWWVF
jgi:hypothetical protein